MAKYIGGLKEVIRGMKVMGRSQIKPLRWPGIWLGLS